MSRIQFGRLCQLEFYNYTTKKQFTIDQSLRISFEFLKSFDESSSSSVGKITIYGLTEATAEKLGDRIDNMFQTEVRCSVGYSGDIENFQTLFYATVMSNKFHSVRGGTTETEIEVSANFASFYLGQVPPHAMHDTTFGEILARLNSVDVYYDLVAPDFLKRKYGEKQFFNAITEIQVKSWVFFERNTADYISQIAETFSLGYTVDHNPPQAKEVRFRNKPRITLMILPNAYEIYEKILDKFVLDNQVYVNYPTGGNVTEPKNTEDLQVNIKDYYLSTNEKTAVTLSDSTGLLELPYMDNRNVKVPYNSQLNANEVITEKEAPKVQRNKKTGEVKRDKDGNVKYTKQKKTMTINRRFLTAKALINPDVKPNSLVLIKTGRERLDGLYRARSCHFSGDTHEGDWVMELELEDTNDYRTASPESTLATADDQVEVISNSTTVTNEMDDDGGGGEE